MAVPTPVDLGPLLPPPQPQPAKTLYTKKTLLRSPVVAQIFPRFSVCLSKPTAGLPSTSLNDENDQTLHAREEDSFFGDAMSEDELWDDLEIQTDQPKNELKDEPTTDTSTNPEFTTVEVVIRLSSISIDGVIFPLNASVTSAVVVPSPKTETGAEDSLLVSLSSGFLLLIRIWQVPRGFADASFGFTANDRPKTPTSHYFKPFVVQWWQLSDCELPATAGNSLSAHPAGLAVVSAASASLFRIHMCEQTQNGLQLSPHFNVPVDGEILHSCFAHPLGASSASSHLIFLTLVFTSKRRLELSLYSWYVSDALSGNLEKATLPLNAFFPIPAMIVPLPRNNSFLFVCPEEFVIVTLHNIWSADYSFSKFAYDGAFPTAFCHPACPVLATESESTTDEILLASESGIIYSVIVEDNKNLTYKGIIKLADPVSVFQFEPSSPNGYDLSYASDTGGSKKLHISKIESFQDEKVPYTDAQLKLDYRNWAPIVDAVVIDSSDSRARVAESTQEFWALTGAGKRTKLTQLCSGYPSKRDSSTYSSLRKGESLSLLQKDDRTFILCSMSFGSRLFEYTKDGVPESGSEMSSREATPAVDENLVEIGDAGLDPGLPTIWCGPLGNSGQFVQFTRNSISFSDIENRLTVSVSDSILFAHMIHDLAFVVSENDSGLRLEILKISPLPSFGEEYEVENQISTVGQKDIDSETCMMKCFEADGKVWTFLGTFDGQLSVSTCDSNFQAANLFDLNLNILIPPKTSNSGIVPHDVVLSPNLTKLYVGCKTGHFVELGLAKSGPQLIRWLKLGTVPLNILFSKSDPNFMFAYGKNVWIFNFYTSQIPQRVSLWDKTEKSVTSMVEIPTTESQYLRFAVVGEEGLVIRSIFCHETPLMKQLSVGEPAKKLVYLDTIGLFILLCKSKSALTRLKYADRKTMKLLPTAEFDPKTDQQKTDTIFAAGEIPLCGLVWEIPREGRVSKKIIVGTSVNGETGSLKILDVSKVTVSGSKSAVVKQVELYSVPRDQPVTSIQQIDSTIFFSCGNCVYSTLYSIDLRKLRPVVKHLTLPSTVVSMSVAPNQNLLVTTEQDSLYSFKWDAGGDVDRTPEDLSVAFKDPTPRSLINACADEKMLYSADKLYSLLYSMNPSQGNSLDLAYKVAMIPRVYRTSFTGCWDTKNEESRQICAVGVNGEIVLLSVVSEESDEVKQLKSHLSEIFGLPEDDPYDKIMDRLERPFADKVTGKGFQSTFKPFFDFKENRHKLVDYDVEELSSVCASNSFI